MEVRNTRKSSVALHSDFQSMQGRGMERICGEVKAEDGFTLYEGRDRRRAREENLVSVRKRHTHSEVKPKILKKQGERQKQH